MFVTKHKHELGTYLPQHTCQSTAIMLCTHQSVKMCVCADVCMCLSVFVLVVMIVVVVRGNYEGERG